MSIAAAEMLLLVLGAYFGVGLLFAIGFVIFGVGRIDPAAKGMPLQARLLVLPGSMLLWPLLAVRWGTGKAPPIS